MTSHGSKSPQTEHSQASSARLRGLITKDEGEALKKEIHATPAGLVAFSSGSLARLRVRLQMRLFLAPSRRCRRTKRSARWPHASPRPAARPEPSHRASSTEARHRDARQARGGEIDAACVARPPRSNDRTLERSARPRLRLANGDDALRSRDGAGGRGLVTETTHGVDVAPTETHAHQSAGSARPATSCATSGSRPEPRVRDARLDAEARILSLSRGLPREAREAVERALALAGRGASDVQLILDDLTNAAVDALRDEAYWRGAAGMPRRVDDPPLPPPASSSSPGSDFRAFGPFSPRRERVSFCCPARLRPRRAGHALGQRGGVRAGSSEHPERYEPFPRWRSRWAELVGRALRRHDAPPRVARAGRDRAHRGDHARALCFPSPSYRSI